MKKILLLSCCTPCSCGAIKELLTKNIQNFDFTVMFYNPNIFPEEEYNKRLKEQINYCKSLNVKIVVGEYNHENWLKSIKGLESEPEQGKRCFECFKFRFLYAKEWAIKNNFDSITSVFGVSRHKNQDQVDLAANAVLDKTIYKSIKFDKNLQNKILKESDFYKQKYCGCEFSILNNKN